MASIHPYINFNGNCEEAFNFYRTVFGGEFSYIGRFKDTPEEAKVPTTGDDSSDEDDKILHVSLPLGKGTMLMGSDCPQAYGPVTFGTAYNISIDAESREDADRIFNALSAGGKVFMPMADAFWGSYFGMLADKFGVQWMVSYSAQHM